MDIEASLGLRLDAIGKHLEELKADYALARIQEQERLRGFKANFRLPIVSGRASGSVLTMGGDTNTAFNVSPAAPELGFIWSIRHLVIEGLTASATTPDVVNILRGGRIVWQLNGNQFAQTWGRGEMVLNQGEALLYQSVGTFASTATILAHGMADQLPAERAGRLA